MHVPKESRNTLFFLNCRKILEGSFFLQKRCPRLHEKKNMLYIVNEVITRKNRLRTSQIHAWGQYVRPWAKRIHGYFG